jgi:hypothetical protein
VPCQVAEGPPGLGPTVPEEGFCARVVRSGIAQNSPILHIRKSVPRVTRAVIEEEFFFINAFGNVSSKLGLAQAVARYY